MIRFINRLIKTHRIKSIIAIAFILALLVSLSGIQIQVASPEQSIPDTISFNNQGIRAPPTISIGQFKFTIGTVQAAGTADYVCDGIRDDIDFQAAIDALPVQGGEIEVLAGTYNFGLGVNLNDVSITLSGVGDSTVLHAYNGVNSNLALDANLGQPNVTVVDASNFIVGMRVCIEDGTPDIEANQIQSIAGNVITMTTNLTANYTVAAGGLVHSANNVIEVSAANCVIENLTIDGNQQNITFSDVSLDNSLQCNVQIFPTGDYTIVRNIISYDASMNGINVQGDYCEIRDNEIYEWAGHATRSIAGIEFNVISYGRCLNNYIHGVGGDGIDCDWGYDSLFEGNISIGNDQEGIESNRPMRNTYDGNIIKDNANGLTLDTAPVDCNISNNIITGNTIGLRLRGAVATPELRCTINNNVISGNDWYGVRLWDYVEECTISNNIVQDNGNTYHGIYLDTRCINNYIIGNKCGNTGVGAQEYGVYINDNTSNNNVVVNNDLRGNDTGAWYDAGVSDTFIGNEGDNERDIAELVRRADWRDFPLNTGWGTNNINTGGVGQTPTSQYTYTGIGANSQGLANTGTLGLSGGGNQTFVDWDKELVIIINYSRTGSDAQAICRFQLKEVNTEGALGAKGIGIRVDNLDLVGESYGVALGTVNLGVTMTAYNVYQIVIIHYPGSRVEWWVNGTLSGTQSTANNIPSGVAGGASYFVHSAINGAGGGVNCYSRIFFLHTWQSRN